MATITFHCPKCRSMCAFSDRFAGRRCRCLKCGQFMLVPTEDGGKSEKLEISCDTGTPLPGFYKAVFINSKKLFTSRQSVIGLIFIVTTVTVQFFTAYLNFWIKIPMRSGGTLDIFVPFGYAMGIMTWGVLLWYYTEIIYSTAYDMEELPEIYIGGMFGFLWTVVKSAYTFLIALLVVELPYIVAIGIFKVDGIELKWPLYVLAMSGLFLLPMAILTASTGRDITMLGRIDYFFQPIIKAFWPYLVLVVLLTITCRLQWIALDYGKLRDSGKVAVLLNLLANIGTQAMAIVTMRAIGIFHRHYNCYLKW